MGWIITVADANGMPVPSICITHTDDGTGDLFVLSIPCPGNSSSSTIARVLVGDQGIRVSTYVPAFIAVDPAAEFLVCVVSPSDDWQAPGIGSNQWDIQNDMRLIARARGTVFGRNSDTLGALLQVPDFVAPRRAYFVRQRVCRGADDAYIESDVCALVWEPPQIIDPVWLDVWVRAVMIAEEVQPGDRLELWILKDAQVVHSESLNMEIADVMGSVLFACSRQN